MPKNKKKKLTKRKKKFFIILSCYIATFIITSIVTVSTLAWFNGDTWQDEVLYMGGPVYIHFSDNSETNVTSGAGELVTHLPPGWEKLYPGMNITFEAKAIIQGHTFENTDTQGNDWTQYTTGAVLRAKIKLEVTDPKTGGSSAVTQDIYNWIWPQLKESGLNTENTSGIWVYDERDTEVDANNYFYYVEKNQEDIVNHTKLILTEVGGKAYDVAVEFLNEAVIQLPGKDLTNEHADCDITFTIVFEAVQAFFPYTQDEVDVAVYQGDNSGRLVSMADVGLGKPLTIENSLKIFDESQIIPTT